MTDPNSQSFQHLLHNKPAKVDHNKHSKTKDKLISYCKRCDSFKASQWIKHNREKRKSYRTNYFKKRYEEDESFILASNLHSRLYKALLDQITRKNSTTEQLLGISFEEFKNYLENLMTPDITWKNIDHYHLTI